MGIIILGRASKQLTRNLNLKSKDKKDLRWYFVDYVPETYKIGTWFKVEYKKGTIAEANGIETYAKLVTCFLDGAFEYEEISQGYKSICQFEIVGKLKIKVIKSWRLSNCRINLLKVDIAKLREENIDKILYDKDK